MTSKVVLVISTTSKEKAMTGLSFANFALARNWLDDVRVIFLGRSCELLLAKDEDVQARVKEFVEKGSVFVCKAIADREGISEDIKEKLGVPIEYVGSIIADAIKDGYTPMVF